MNRFASLCVLVLAGSLPGFASVNHHGLNPQNQFHFQPVGRRATSARSMKATQASLHKANVPEAYKSEKPGQGVHGPALARTSRPHPHTANPPTGKIGFVSATQIPTGGGTGQAAFSGDFNGDGKPDLVTIVQTNYSSTTHVWTYSISVVLSNGDGTFQAPVLTHVPNNDSCAALVVGDVNGDKKDDIIVAHQPNCNNNGYTTPTIDVLIGDGTGNFTASNNTNSTIPTSGLAGGTLADVNGDGKLDLIAVDQNNPAGVWTLLGNGDGTFQPPTSVALSGEAGNNVTLVDLNGDGLLDIADLDYSTNTLTVYLATSATTYAPGVPYSTSDNNGTDDGCYMTAGDLTGDGKPEIVVSNCQNQDDNLTVFVNNGDGSFQSGVYYTAATNSASGTGGDVWPSGISIADVNGDGKADIISSNYYGADVTILTGNGDGTVNVPSVGYAVGGYPFSPAIVADFNGDGLADIVVPDDEFSFVYLKGYGDGTFRSALDYYSPIPDNGFGYGINVATGDFNGDGIPDFVLSNCCDNSLGVTVFLSRSDGSLQPGVNYVNSTNIQDLRYVAVADFNGDGILDIAASDYYNGVVQIFTGNGSNGIGDGTFSVGGTFATDVTSSNPQELVAGDFNGDGHPDIAVTNESGNNVGVLLNDGTGNFQPVVNYPLSSGSNFEIATADLNADGNLDLIVPLWTGSNVAVMLGNGDGTFQAEVDSPALPNPNSVTVADMNNDGKPDLVMAIDEYPWTALNAQGIAIAIGNGDGTFQTPTLLASALHDTNFDSPWPGYIKTVDVDGDGNTDIVYTNSEYGTLGILFGQGSGSFYDPVEYPSGGYAFGLAVADVNGDGAPDVVTAGDDFSGVTVLLNNNGSGTQPNFAVGVTQNSATVTAGNSATYNLTVTASNLFEGSISFTCSGLPSKSSCSFSPTSLTPAGNLQTPVQLTISTTAATTAALVPGSVNPHSGASMLLASLSGMGTFGMLFAGSLKKRNRWMGLLLGVLLVTMMFSLVGCGGSSNNSNNNNGGGTPGTPAGTYTVQVTGTGNGVSHNVQLTLTVQ